MFLLMRQMVRRRGCNYSIVNNNTSDIPLHILACEYQYIKRPHSNFPILIELDEE